LAALGIFCFWGKKEGEEFTQSAQRRSAEGTEEERKKITQRSRRAQRALRREEQGWEEEIWRRKIVRTRKMG
jgi:hypothetical protein